MADCFKYADKIGTEVGPAALAATVSSNKYNRQRLLRFAEICRVKQAVAAAEDGRKPKLAPSYDFVSTIAYIDDRKMALSIAKEKDTKFLDEQLLERFAAKARVPKNIVLDTALATAERTVNAWTEHSSELPIGKETRDKIDEQLRYVPLTRRFLKPI